MVRTARWDSARDDALGIGQDGENPVTAGCAAVAGQVAAELPTIPIGGTPLTTIWPPLVNLGRPVSIKLTVSSELLYATLR